MISDIENKRGYTTSEAMKYLGMKRKAFDKHVKPLLTPLPFGTSRLYDKLDLDRVWDEYKRRNERLDNLEGVTKWAENKPESIKTKLNDGVWTKSIEELDFESVSKRLKKLKTG